MILSSTMRRVRRLVIPTGLVAAIATLPLQVGPIRTADVAAAQQDHAYSSADVEAGSRLYVSQCLLCHATNGDGVTGIDLRRGQFRRSVSDEDIAKVITGGIAGSGMPSFTLQPAEVTGLIAFIRAGFEMNATAVRVGNPARGKTLFSGKGACSSCHRAQGAGSRVAPDLNDIGLVRSPAALQRTLLNPSSGMMPINRPVRIVTKAGDTVTGRRLNEDTFSVQIIDSNERLRTFVKSDLRELAVSPTSTMPAASSVLTGDEIADVIAYLLSLKGLS